jgi:hypothetical protein
MGVAEMWHFSKGCRDADAFLEGNQSFCNSHSQFAATQTFNCGIRVPCVFAKSA